MRITRLRLTGFKSFVDTTDFLIEPGLTGVVGPNGCGKSNLLESLRWAMGATSAKAMRGDGMDDVIFAGTDVRPARNHAEVVLTLENDEGRAPAPWHAEPLLEISRRIDRGEGSTYRINGSEVRARDVQLLFADASTGANSPALVRQGQISELIASAPRNRRRILEEAAGVSGLHGRRHEAELKVAAAETNLSRLADVAVELESALARLRREARAAARYKKLGAEIRGLRAAVAHARWTAAVVARQNTAEVWKAAEAASQSAIRDATAAVTRALDAAARLPALRDEQAIAATVHQRALLEQDRAERAAAEAKARIDGLNRDLVRIDADLAREALGAAEARTEVQSAAAQLAEIEALAREAPSRAPELESRSREADAHRRAAERAADAVAGELASALGRERSDRERIAESELRVRELRGATDKANAERDALARSTNVAFMTASTECDQIADTLARAAERLESLDTDRLDAVAAETRTHAAARAAEDALAEVEVELRALNRLTAQSRQSAGATLLDRISAEAGFELALAAALGDDVGASLEPSASVFWRELSTRDGAETPRWPEGVRPLAEVVTAPARLSARLALTGLVAAADGERLQADLPNGARLVSAEGSLWRWDGFVSRPGAPSPAAVRLRQKARIAGLSADVERLAPLAVQAKAHHADAAGAMARAEQAVRALRSDLGGLEKRLATARVGLDGLRREEDGRLSRLAAIEGAAARLEAEFVAESSRLETLRGEVRERQDHEPVRARLETLRAVAVAARDEAVAARSALEVAARATAERQQRLQAARAAATAWAARGARAETRLKDLADDRAAAAKALEAARDIPASIDATLHRLIDETAVAEERRRRADDALTTADAAKSEADRLARAAEARSADLREVRASAAAQLEAADARAAETAETLREMTGLSPDEVGEALMRDAIAIPADAPGAEGHLASLEREQAMLGAVNLLAEDEAEAVAERLHTLGEEQGDLRGALARLRQAIAELNAEGRERLNAAFVVIDGYFRELFTALFQGGAAELRLVESDDPLEAGLEIFACPPGKRMAVMSLMSGGEQALTAVALIFAVFLANPAPICVLDEVDAPLDDANVERFCNLLAEMRRRAATRFVTITHNPLTMSRMDRLFGVTMRERGVSQLVSVDLGAAAALAER
jgi:chromosome segregation protein